MRQVPDGQPEGCDDDDERLRREYVAPVFPEHLHHAVSAGNASGMPVNLTIPSDFSASREVQKRILDEVERQGFDPHSTFAIKLALEEALINAIKHGNKLNMSKSVHIEYSVSPERVEIIIEDEGPGFDRCSVPDPTLEENLEKCSGRGILLMEAYMNTVEYSKDGRRVRMVKYNEPDPSAQ